MSDYALCRETYALFFVFLQYRTTTNFNKIPELAMDLQKKKYSETNLKRYVVNRSTNMCKQITKEPSKPRCRETDQKHEGD